MKTGFRNLMLLTLALAFTPSAALYADPGASYCITPPFITAGLKPNLLMLLDNSASMYDLTYTDGTTHNYCANDPATSCTPTGSVCSGAAICKITATTTTTVTKSPIICTSNADCRPPNPGGVINDNCQIPHAAASGQCNKAYLSTTTTTTTPKACTTDSDCTATGDSCNNRCAVSTTPCVDSTYSNTGDYPGYFVQSKLVAGVTVDVNYCYSTKSGLTTCTNSGSYNEFDPDSNAMPAACTYGGSGSTTPFVCINTSLDASTPAKEYVTKFVASGRFLNWLAMSKFDIEKSILTGGKYMEGALRGLVGESRGCSGRKFIKTLPALPAISFAVRGGTATVGSTSQATQYGQSVIEIFKGTYNAGACAAALNDWQNVSGTNLGPLQVDTKSCIGGTGSLSDKLAAATQTIHDCYWYFNGHGLTNLQPIENTCAKVYENTPAGEITDPNDPAAICSNSISHAASVNDGGVGNTTGYLGKCFTGGVWDDACALIENKDFCQTMGGAGAVSDPSSEAGVSQTVQNVPGFVMELGLGNLQMINDYTILSPANANATKGFPLAVYDSSNYSPWPPAGLIQKYKDNMRLGIMTFANNGSGSECATSGSCSATSTNAGTACSADATCTGGGKCIFQIPCAKTCSNLSTRQCNSDADCSFTVPETGVASSGTCGALSKKDGGVIVSYVGSGFCATGAVMTATPCDVDSECSSGQHCAPSVGDHTSGLLKKVDDIQATSWTPFGEAFYNAIGYFARTNDYVSAATTPLSRSDNNFSALPSPNTETSYNTSKNPSQYKCQSNNLLLVTDGMSTADQSSVSEGLATLYAGQIPYFTTIGGTVYKPGDVGYDSTKTHGYDSVNQCPPFSGSRSIADLAWIARNRNIKTLSTSTASTTAPAAASENIISYVVYSGPQVTSSPGLCDPKTLMANTATNGGTTLLSAANPTDLYTKLDKALSDVAAKAASGTAASILSNSEGSGANILQAVFYPKKIFDNSTAVSWIGEMQNLWYFVDPYIQNSTIREDSDNGVDRELWLNQDDVVRFAFDSASDRTLVQRYSDSDGDGIVTDSDKVGGLIDPDYVRSIWRAGMRLWARSDSGTTARKIYTGYNSTSGSEPTLFSSSSLASTSAVWDLLQIPTTAQIPGITDTQRETLASKLINYIRGTDQSVDTSPFCLNSTDCSYRPRRVTMGVCSGDNQRRCTVNTDCLSGSCVPTTNEWKLGDIIASTPRVQSTVRLNTYDLPSPGGYSDQTYLSFIGSNDYTKRGMVYVGANDGMLHAFNLGTLSVRSSGFKKASLGVPTDHPILGNEEWAFIPANSLPYLKYFTDNGYKHLYYIDGRTVIFDASVGYTNSSASCVKNSYWLCDKPRNGSISMVDGSKNLDPAKNVWRTIVITGMGLGGATRDNVAGETCTEGASGSCIKTPIAGTGLSTYFALDVTDPNNPKYLWEFSNNKLGNALSSPAIVRVGDKDKNGRWFAVFGNGPFGPIDPGSTQYKAESTHHLRFFVVDLLTGDLLATLNDTNTLGINNAFAGTMLGGSIDADRRDTSKAGNYSDDAIYAGFVRKGSDNKWSDGGVVRIMTKENQDPTQWVVSTLIDGIGPVTTAIARSQDTKNRNLWLYFGTGRYFFRDADGVDDRDNQRALFGIKEPCYNKGNIGNALDSSCTDSITVPSGTKCTDIGFPMINQTSSVGAVGTAPGWCIALDNSTATEGAERVVTDTVALINGTVFYTSFKPTMDICGYGGNSFLWGVKYDTGGQAAANALTGKALIQLSTGEFREVDLSSAFTDKGGRRMASPMTGKPPSDAPPIVSSSQNKPLKKILHIQEH